MNEYVSIMTMINSYYDKLNNEKQQMIEVIKNNNDSDIAFDTSHNRIFLYTLSELDTNSILWRINEDYTVQFAVVSNENLKERYNIHKLKLNWSKKYNIPELSFYKHNVPVSISIIQYIVDRKINYNNKNELLEKIQEWLKDCTIEVENIFDIFNIKSKYQNEKGGKIDEFSFLTGINNGKFEKYLFKFLDQRIGFYRKYDKLAGNLFYAIQLFNNDYQQNRNLITDLLYILSELAYYRNSSYNTEELIGNLNDLIIYLKKENLKLLKDSSFKIPLSEYKNYKKELGDKFENVKLNLVIPIEID